MGKVNHFEIPYDDRNRAHKFYADVFGWEIKDSGVPGMDYDMAYTVPVDDKLMLKEKGTINGGMTRRSAPGEGPVVVVTVDDLADTLAKTQARGGIVAAEPLRRERERFLKAVASAKGLSRCRKS